MRIKSFVDVVSTDPACSKYTMADLEIEKDLFSGEMISYSSNVPYGAYAQNSIEEVLKLRELITTCLATQKHIIIIDHSREKIFSDIQDPFFLRIAQNTEYEFRTIDANRTITKIIEKAFPIPKKIEAPSLRERCLIV